MIAINDAADDDNTYADAEDDDAVNDDNDEDDVVTNNDAIFSCRLATLKKALSVHPSVCLWLSLWPMDPKRKS